MHHELIIAGFGGQGVLLAGQLLAWAANKDGCSVVWSPAYGPEMRGGASHCTVIISSTPVGSPIVAHPDSEIIMDAPSMPLFVPRLKPGGLLIMNSSLIRSAPERDDLLVRDVAANELAEEVGDVRSANVVILGVLVGLVPLVQEDSLQAALHERWSGSPKLLELNKRALQAGMNAAKNC